MKKYMCTLKTNVLETDITSLNPCFLIEILDVNNKFNVFGNSRLSNFESDSHPKIRFYKGLRLVASYTPKKNDSSIFSVLNNKIDWDIIWNEDINRFIKNESDYIFETETDEEALKKFNNLCLNKTYDAFDDRLFIQPNKSAEHPLFGAESFNELKDCDFTDDDYLDDEVDEVRFNHGFFDDIYNFIRSPLSKLSIASKLVSDYDDFLILAEVYEKTLKYRPKVKFIKIILDCQYYLTDKEENKESCLLPVICLFSDLVPKTDKHKIFKNLNKEEFFDLIFNKNIILFDSFKFLEMYKTKMFISKNIRFFEVGGESYKDIEECANAISMLKKGFKEEE